MTSTIAATGSKETPPAETRKSFSWCDPHPIFVVVFVGSERRPFGIQKDFLCHRSSYYYNHFYAKGKQPETVEYTVELPDTTPQLFGLLQKYMYTEKLECEDYDQLVGLWRLGNKLGVDGVCDETLEAMIRCRRNTGRIPATPLLVQVWKDTPEGSPIRTLLLSWAAEYMRSSDMRAEFAKSLPQEVLSELVVAMSSLEATPAPAPSEPSDGAVSASRKNVHYLEEPADEASELKRAKRMETVVAGANGLLGESRSGIVLGRKPSRASLAKPQKRRSSAAILDPDSITPAQKLEFCSDLLTRMLSGPGFWTRLVGPFKEPVEPKEDGVPDYFDKVKRPMDLSTIKAKMDAGEYKDEEQFLADIRQIFTNCFLYWKKGEPMYAAGEKLQKTFEDKYSQMAKWVSKMGGTEDE